MIWKGKVLALKGKKIAGFLQDLNRFLSVLTSDFISPLAFQIIQKEIGDINNFWRMSILSRTKIIFSYSGDLRNKLYV